MKKIIDWAKIWIWLIFIISIFWLIALYIVKARWTPPNDLQSSPGDKLTSQKWNELAAKASLNYSRQIFTDGDVSFGPATTSIASFSFSNHWNNPVLVSANWRINCTTAVSVGCYIYIDWISQNWANFWETCAVWNRKNVSINFISNNLSAWAHTYNLSCLMWAAGTNFTFSKSSRPLYFSAMELKQ